MYSAHVAAPIAKFINILSLSWDLNTSQNYLEERNSSCISHKVLICVRFFFFSFWLCVSKKKKKIAANSPRLGNLFSLFIYFLFSGLLSIAHWLNKTDSRVTISKARFSFDSLLLRDGTASNITSVNLASGWGRGVAVAAIYLWNYISTGCVHPCTWTLTRGG